MGRFDATAQCRVAVDLQRQGPGGVVRLGRVPDASLLVGLDFDGTEVAISAVYDSTEERDGAAERISDARERVLGGELKTTLCLRHPLPVVPSRRFKLAAELIFGESLGGRYSTGLRSTRSVEATIEQKMQQRAETLEAVRSLCSPEELLAYDLVQPTGIAWATDEIERDRQRWLNTEIATVAGLTGAHRMADREPKPEGRPYDFMYLTDRAGLRPGQHVTHVLWQGGVERRANAFVEQLEALIKEAASFNEQQDRLKVPSDLSELQALVSVALARRHSDAVELASRVSGLPPYDAATATGVLGIVSPAPQDGDFPQFLISWVELDGPFEEGHVRLVLEADEDRVSRAMWRDPTSLFFQYGVPPDRKALRWGTSELTGGLANWLGYGEREIETWELHMSLGGINQARQVIARRTSQCPHARG